MVPTTFPRTQWQPLATGLHRYLLLDGAQCDAPQAVLQFLPHDGAGGGGSAGSLTVTHPPARLSARLTLHDAARAPVCASNAQTISCRRLNADGRDLA